MNKATVYVIGYCDERPESLSEARHYKFEFICSECGEKNQFAQEIDLKTNEFRGECLGCFREYDLVINII